MNTHMKKISLVTLLVLTSACSTLLPNKPNADASISDPKGVVEQVLFEQQQPYRPEYVSVTNDYVEFGDGQVLRNTGIGTVTPLGNGAIAAGSSNSRTKNLVTRIYFRSIKETRLYSRRGVFRVLVFGHDGLDIATIHTRSMDAATKFMDAVAVLSKTANSPLSNTSGKAQ